MKSSTQLKKWLNGEWVHNPTGGPDRKGECTPDFGCCIPECKASKAIRVKFCKATADGDDKTVSIMLGRFLAKMLENRGYNVKTSEGTHVRKSRATANRPSGSGKHNRKHN